MEDSIKWLCVQCGARKEEYEAMYCDTCYKNVFLPEMDAIKKHACNEHECEECAVCEECGIYRHECECVK